MNNTPSGIAVSKNGNLTICPVCSRGCYLKSIEDPFSSGDNWLWTTFHHRAEAPRWEETICYKPSYQRARVLNGSIAFF